MPAIISADDFEAAQAVSRDNSAFSPRHTTPGHWLLRGLVTCGTCHVKAYAHQMTSPSNGNKNRYYVCSNHDAIRAGGPEHLCPEARVRADELDSFVWDQVHAVLTQPEVLLAGEQALAGRAPPPTTNCSASNSTAWPAGSTRPTANVAASPTSTRPE